MRTPCQGDKSIGNRAYYQLHLSIGHLPFHPHSHQLFEVEEILFPTLREHPLLVVRVVQSLSEAIDIKQKNGCN